MNVRVQKISEDWDGDKLQVALRTAAGRGVLAVGVNTVNEAKGIVHSISGNLKRSIHVAPKDYAGEVEEILPGLAVVNNAPTEDIPNIGLDEVSQTARGAEVEVGSWLPYACVEETGRGHQYIQPAVELAKASADGIFLRALKESGL